MKEVIVLLSILVLLVAGCTQVIQEDTQEKIGDKSTDSLGDDISDFNEIDSELGAIEDINVDELDF